MEDATSKATKAMTEQIQKVAETAVAMTAEKTVTLKVKKQKALKGSQDAEAAGSTNKNTPRAGLTMKQGGLHKDDEQFSNPTGPTAKYESGVLSKDAQ